ncbi:MAG TPA: hypothetical protein VG675_04855 [Bryobacteraceae bacterium]|nr:hypothetical protein [Bryobacteraceae bacterium]
MGAVAGSRRISFSRGAQAVLCVASVAFSLSSAVAAEIVCSPTLVQKSDWGYSKRTPDRCEGEYFHVAANPGYSSVLHVVSLVARFGAVDPQHDQTILVQWKGAPPSDVVTLTVTSLRPEHYYRMDANVSSKASAYEWPTMFARHETLRPFELALLAQTSRGVLLPVTVGVPKDPSAPPKPFLVIKTTKPLSDLQYTLRRIDARRPAKAGPEPKPVPVTGEFITIPLSLPSAGDYNFSATAHVKNGPLVALPLTFHYVE